MSSNEPSKLRNWLLERPVVIKTRDFLRGISPWGVDGMNLYDVLRFFFRGLINGSVSIRAAAISYNMLLAVFPAIILLLSILPHTPLETEEVLSVLEFLFPGETVVLLEQTITDLLDKTQGTILSIGFVLTLFYASSSVNAILSGFNASYLIENKGRAWYSTFMSM